MMSLTRLLAIAAIVSAAACGNSTGSGGTPPPPPPPPGPPPPPPPPPGGHSTTITVGAGGELAFSPTPDTIPAGSITFHFASATAHNVTWQTGPGTLPTGSGNRSSGDADYAATLVAGDYTYHCTLHAGMNGAIHVNP
jgi:plastocyanin